MNNSRQSRRGSILMVSMAYVLLVSITGSLLLTVSYIHQVQMEQKARAVRLITAAEAGIETKRGRFTLVQGAQEDWALLLPTTGWNNIDTPMLINGATVSVQAMPLGGASVPSARIRAIATIGNTSRAVEYQISIASFADYALYFGGSSTTAIGANFKMWGNFYSEGAIDLQYNSGIEFFLKVTTANSVRNAPDRAYNFKIAPTENSPRITIPPAAYGMDVLKAVAVSKVTCFYSNTISIQLLETQFVRTFYYRKSGTGSSFVAANYEVRTETKNIPEESVIYIDSSRVPVGVDCWNPVVQNYQLPAVAELGLSGTLYDRRLTVACEFDIAVTGNVAYRSLLNNPSLRRFANKTSAGALAYKEMLGVVSATDIDFKTTLWPPLLAAQEVSNISGDTGHEGNQYCLDGVFMGMTSARRVVAQSPTDRELWVCGGIINGNFPSTQFGDTFERRNYDWDGRLTQTTPPYFLRAYNVSATQVKGTWRSYTL